MRTLICLVGPTCTGKSTLEKALNRLGVPSVVSYTTRKPRTGEVQGKDYNFLTVDEIEFLEEQGKVIQKVEFSGNYYGSTTKSLDTAFKDSHVAVIVVEPTGVTQFREYAASLKDQSLEVVSVYIDNGFEVLTRRLIDRYRSDTNGDPAYYWQRLNDLEQAHRDWPTYNDNWNLYLSSLDDQATGACTVHRAAKRILEAFGRSKVVHGCDAHVD